MNIERKNIDAVNATIKISLGKSDYQDGVDKILRSYKKQANIPGFRPGYAPMGMIVRQFGKQAKAEQLDKLVSESLFKYIEDNKIKVLGEPLPNRTEQDAIDFDKQEDFEFNFDIAVEPEFDVDVNGKSLPYYEIAVTDEMIDNTIKQYKSRYGVRSEGEDIQENDVVKGELVEMRTKTKAKEDGIVIEEAVLCPKYFKDDEQKALLLGVKLNGHANFNPNKAYAGSDVELASLLKISKEEAAKVTSDFKFTVKSISRYTDAEVNQELFDKVFGEGSVKSEEEFKNKIKDNMVSAFSQDADYKLFLDTKLALLKDLENVQFPDDFLKRWVLETNKDMKAEDLDKQYPAMLNDLKWHIIKRKFSEANNLKVEKDDVESYAKKVAQAQFAQYGMSEVPADVLENYTKEMFKKREYIDRLVDQALDEKVMVKVKELVSLDKKSISMDEFNKLFQEQNQAAL